VIYGCARRALHILVELRVDATIIVHPVVFHHQAVDSTGDTSWAAMVFWILMLAAPHRRTDVHAAPAVGVSWAVEVSQLVRAPWLDAARSTRLGALALGQGVLWSDLVCYALGAPIAAAIDLAVHRPRRLWTGGPRKRR
jgi:hypothetical protein